METIHCAKFARTKTEVPSLDKKAAFCDLVSALMKAFFFTEQVVLCGLYTSPDGFSHVEGAGTEYADTDYALWEM